MAVNPILQRDPETDHTHNIETMSFNGVLYSLAESGALSSVVENSPVELAKAAVTATQIWEALETLGLVVEPQ